MWTWWGILIETIISVHVYEILFLEAASVAEEVPRASEGGRLLIEFISNFIDPWWKSINFLLLLVVTAHQVLLLLDAFGFAGFLDALPEVVEQVMWKHELIYLLLGLAGIVFVVNTVELKPFGFVHWAAGRGEGNGDWWLSPYRRKFLELHITSLLSSFINTYHHQKRALNFPLLSTSPTPRGLFVSLKSSPIFLSAFPSKPSATKSPLLVHRLLISISFCLIVDRAWIWSRVAI